MMDASILREQIKKSVEAYYQAFHESGEEFIERQTRIDYAGRVFDSQDMVNLVDCCLDFWLTHGRYAVQFEKRMADFLGIKYCALVNSGSSANLLAFMALTSPQLGDRRIRRGDEVITVAACFPTTVSPIIHYGAVPVFVDVDLETANIDCSKLDKALSDRTKAVMLAHTLGNPFNIRRVKDFCRQNNLWLIEDNCDSLGSTFDNRYTGTHGDLGTSSFYPPHHITMGEGGAVYTDNPVLNKIVRSLRDWGRDCWCESGFDNTCQRRFSQQFGTLPFGYDHKYVYGHFGYNLKATDMQASIGCSQLLKLSGFIEARRDNFIWYTEKIKKHEKHFILPRTQDGADPAWFGFLLTVREEAPFDRNEIVTFLESRKIQTRSLFCGNIVRQPLMQDLVLGTDYRISGGLDNTDYIMNNSFWIGVYSGITEKKREYVVKSINEFIMKFK